MFDFEKVVLAYRQNFINFGFIPRPTLEMYYRKNRFYYNDDGWVLIGSLKSKVTPIYAVYVYPEKRDGNTNKVKSLLKLLPEKPYRVRCHFGETFWRWAGLVTVRVENKNSRKRNITVLEGTLSLAK